MHISLYMERKIKGRIEVTRWRGRRRKLLLYDLGDRRGYSHLKEEALDRIKWRNRFGRGCGPVVWQITNEWKCTNSAHFVAPAAAPLPTQLRFWIHENITLFRRITYASLCSTKRKVNMQPFNACHDPKSRSALSTNFTILDVLLSNANEYSQFINYSRIPLNRNRRYKICTGLKELYCYKSCQVCL
jgi:hypothetical protein